MLLQPQPPDMKRLQTGERGEPPKVHSMSCFCHIKSTVNNNIACATKSTKNKHCLYDINEALVMGINVRQGCVASCSHCPGWLLGASSILRPLFATVCKLSVIVIASWCIARFKKSRHFVIILSVCAWVKNWPSLHYIQHAGSGFLAAMNADFCEADQADS
jgi:hypothetical protein